MWSSPIRKISAGFYPRQSFIAISNVCLILGDTFSTPWFSRRLLKKAVSLDRGAIVFGYYVKDPER
jgi:glucose-1-phosphate thymidylyltransferase